ncbi:MAG: AAA family ATPase, partial [Candidatus Poribacteria bacterium]
EAVSQLGRGISVGINTGMMYFGPIGTLQQHLEISAYGLDIILAKRLQEVAQSGQIFVGEGTYRPTRRSFEFELLPPLNLKGIAEPVTAYSALKALLKPEKIRGIEGLTTEMIGREEEFSQLKGCVDDLLAGKGQIVSIIGEAGLGKSRLSTELKEYIKDKNIRWLEGRCVSIGEPVGYSVFIDILRSYLEFFEEESEKEIGKKIADKTKELFPQKWESVVPYIGNLLSVKFGNEWDEQVKHLTPEQVKYQTCLNLRDLFLALANRKPLLLILEDLHWADNPSLDLLSLLMDELHYSPLMLLCIYRPEKEHKSWNIGTQASGKCSDRYSEITLKKLNTRESRILLESLLRVEKLPEGIKESILEKSEGNPFFIEEVLCSLIDSGVIYRDGGRWATEVQSSKSRLQQDISVPDTIQSVIMTRIDGLNDEVRYALQCAAVIGRLFQYKLLSYITQREQNLDGYLSQLQDKELIYEERAIPEPEYSFRHALIQETVYQNLLSRHRQVLHKKVGDGIERLYQDRIEEFYEELAWHYSESKYPPKAIDYLLKAGEKSKRMDANQEAIRYFEKALDFIREQPAGEIRVSLEITARELLGDLLFTIGEHRDAEVQLNQALSLISKEQDARHIATLTWKLADIIHWQGRFDQAIEIAESGLTALGEQIHTPEAANLLEVISRSYWAKEDWESARRYADQNAQIIRQIPYFDAIYKIYYSFAWLEMGVDNFPAAIAWLEELEQVCLANDNQVGLARCYHGMGDFYRSQEDFHQASQWLEKSLSYCERIGDAHLLLEGHLELAYLLILLDESPNHIDEHIQRGMEIANQMASASQVVASASGCCEMLGDAYLEKGYIEQAILYFRRAIEFGPLPSALVRLLRKLEPLYAQQGQHKEFFDFCQQMQREMTSQSQTSLRYWHLKEGSPATDYSQSIWWDSFEGQPLREEWRWIDPCGKSSYDFVQPGMLELRTPAGHDLSPTNPNAPRLLRQVSGDFAVETKLVGITKAVRQIGGLLLWASEETYLSFGKSISDINEMRLEDCQQGHQEIIGRGWLPGCELYLRLERRGKSVSVLCSNDGKQWKSCGGTSFPVDNPVWIGIYVACPARLSNSVMNFKDFKLFQRSEG